MSVRLSVYRFEYSFDENIFPPYPSISPPPISFPLLLLRALFSQLITCTLMKIIHGNKQHQYADFLVIGTQLCLPCMDRASFHTNTPLVKFVQPPHSICVLSIFQLPIVNLYSSLKQCHQFGQFQFQLIAHFPELTL